MSQYPEKSYELDKLITNKMLKQAVLDGKKTQQRRHGVLGYPGEHFNLDGVEFEITALEEKTLGDMSETDAIAEGFDSIETYRNFIMKMHKGMSLNLEAKLWVHKFRRTDEV